MLTCVGICDGSVQMRMLKRDRRVHQRLFAKQLKRVAYDDKIPAAAAVELLNELGLLTADPDEHVRLWSNQYERVGKGPPARVRGVRDVCVR